MLRGLNLQSSTESQEAVAKAILRIYCGIPAEYVSEIGAWDRIIVCREERSLNPLKALEESEDPRIRFAGERTLLAWIRTGLAMMGFGFVVARFGLFLREMSAVRGIPIPSSPGLSIWIGSSLIVLGVAVNLIAAMQHAKFLRRLQRGDFYAPPTWSLGIIVSMVLAVIGIGMTMYLIVSIR